MCNIPSRKWEKTTGRITGHGKFSLTTEIVGGRPVGVLSHSQTSVETCFNFQQEQSVKEDVIGVILEKNISVQLSHIVILDKSCYHYNYVIL